MLELFVNEKCLTGKTYSMIEADREYDSLRTLYLPNGDFTTMSMKASNNSSDHYMKLNLKHLIDFIVRKEGNDYLIHPKRVVFVDAYGSSLKDPSKNGKSHNNGNGSNHEDLPTSLFTKVKNGIKNSIGLNKKDNKTHYPYSASFLIGLDGDFKSFDVTVPYPYEEYEVGKDIKKISIFGGMKLHFRSMDTMIDEIPRDHHLRNCLSKASTLFGDPEQVQEAYKQLGIINIPKRQTEWYSMDGYVDCNMTKPAIYKNHN